MITKPTVELLNFTPLWVGADATRTCWDKRDLCDSKFVYECEYCGFTAESKEELNPSDDDEREYECPHCESISFQYYKKTGDADKELIDRVGNKYKHASTLEHINYNFHISNISRALLQELARHRMANYSVKSSRYTLQELVKEDPFIVYDHGITFNPDDTHVNYYPERVHRYVVATGDEDTDMLSALALENIRKLLVKNHGKNRDKIKFCLPESYKTELAWTINARSLQNFLALRSNKSALWEIRNLAYEVFNQLPTEHKFLFEEHMYKEKDSNE